MPLSLSNTEVRQLWYVETVETVVAASSRKSTVVLARCIAMSGIRFYSNLHTMKSPFFIIFWGFISSHDSVPSAYEVLIIVVIIHHHHHHHRHVPTRLLPKTSLPSLPGQSSQNFADAQEYSKHLNSAAPLVEHMG